MSKETAFLAVYPALTRIQRAACDLSEVCAKLAETHSPERGSDDWQSLGAATDRLQREMEGSSVATLSPAYIAPLAEAVTLASNTHSGRDGEALEVLAEELDKSLGLVDVYLEVLAIHAFGRWGADFFFLCAENLPSEYFDLRYRDPGLLWQGVESTDLPASPPDAEWAAKEGWGRAPGSFAYNGRVFPVMGIKWKLLAALVDADGPVAVSELKRAGWPNDSDLIETKLIRTHLSELRHKLIHHLKLPADFEPIPLVDRGDNAAWELNPRLRRGDVTL